MQVLEERALLPCLTDAVHCVANYTDSTCLGVLQFLFSTIISKVVCNARGIADIDLCSNDLILHLLLLVVVVVVVVGVVVVVCSSSFFFFSSSSSFFFLFLLLLVVVVLHLDLSEA